MTKNFQTTVQKVKKHGYWQVRFLPSEPLKREQGTRQQMREILTKSSIALRGWDYPHIATDNSDHQALYLSGDHFEGWIDWHQYIEVLRLYDNGQYIHLFGMYEDWWNEDGWLPVDHPLRQIQPGERFEVIGLVYRMTEIFAFLRNLYENDFYDGDVDVEITLKNTDGRKLTLSDPRRIPLWGGYLAHSESIGLTKKTVTKEEILADFQGIALKYILEVFEQFQWTGFSVDVVKQDQKNLLERKL